MTMSHLPPDGVARRHEVEPLTHRIIRASAGSGKTYQLTNRYLGLLARQERAEAILATTFTRKAAGEILARVLGRLALAASDTSERKRLRGDLELPALAGDTCTAMLGQLVRSLHRLAISTIDSFFHRVASSFRYELDMPLAPRIVDEGNPLSRQLRLEAIEAMLADHDLHVLLDLLRRLHHDSVARSVTQAIDSIVTDLYDVYREAPEPEVWSRIETPPGLLATADLATAVNALRDMEPALPATAKGDPNKTWAKAWGISVSAAELRDWEAFLATGIVAKIAAGETTYSRAEIDAAWLATYQPLIDHARAAVIDRLARQMQATYDLLQRFDIHYTRLRREHGVLLFSDLTHKLARLLPSLGDALLMEVYYRLDGQVAHLLLDEFQDTSLEQWRVLGPFAAEVLAHGDASRSFFCVGDTKQAIYGWRGGCVELFDQVEQALAELPDARQSLSKSYRSSQVVLDAVNQVFEGLTDCDALAEDAEAAARWQAGFEHHVAARDLPGHVRLITSPAAGACEDDGEEEDEAAPASPHEAFAAEQVEAICAAAPGRSVGVLVSTNRAVHRLLFELRKRGVHASGEGGNPVTDSPAVAAVLAAMTLADHPGHTAAAFHVANSPLGEVVGLTGTHPADVQAGALRIRTELLNEGYAGVVARWVRELAPSCDQRNLTRLTQLVELAERYGEVVTLRPSQFVAYIEATPVEEPAPAPVRVMTIHASKGLEFDAVVLPELDRRLSVTWPILVERAEPTGPITGVYPGAKQAIREQVPAMQAAYVAQRMREREEDLCNLYVAMTRARHALHMIVKPLEPKKDGTPRSTGLCFASILRQRLGGKESYTGREVLYEQGDADWGGGGEAHAEPAEEPADTLQVRLAAPSKRGARRSWLAVSPSGLEAAGHVRGADLLDLDTHLARRRGTLIHAWFEAIGFIEDGIPDHDTLLAIGRRAAPRAATSWLQGRLEELRAMLDRPAVRQALERNGADLLWRERTFAVREKGRLMRGSFDRVAVRHERQRPVAATLIDFKTDRYDAAAVERYRPQVLAYRRALSRVLGLDESAITAKLLFVGSGDVAEV